MTGIIDLGFLKVASVVGRALWEDEYGNRTGRLEVAAEVGPEVGTIRGSVPAEEEKLKGSHSSTENRC